MIAMMPRYNNIVMDAEEVECSQFPGQPLLHLDFKAIFWSICCLFFFKFSNFEFEDIPPGSVLQLKRSEHPDCNHCCGGGTDLHYFLIFCQDRQNGSQYERIWQSITFVVEKYVRQFSWWQFWQSSPGIVWFTIAQVSSTMSWMTIRVSLMICMGRYDGIILEYTNAWFIKKVTKIPSCWFQNCQLRSTALAGAQIVLERARHLESTLDNNVLLQYLDAVLFDQYLCKGNILHHTLIVKYLILRIFSQVCGRISSYLSSIPGPRRWVVKIQLCSQYAAHNYGNI